MQHVAGEPARLRLLDFEQFRVYESLQLQIPDPGLRIVGPNGSGKSSILEGVLLLSTTRSRRGVLDADLIRHTSGLDLGVSPYARVRGEVHTGATRARIEIYIERDAASGSTKKLTRVADTPRRATDVVGLLPTVGFSPEDLELVTGSPSGRRRFLDVLISQVDRQYMRHLSRYGRMMTQRNGLLRNLTSANQHRGELVFWNEQVVALGSHVLAARVQAIDRLGHLASRHFEALAPRAGTLDLAYNSTLERPEAWWQELPKTGSVEDAAQRIGSAYENVLDESLAEDIARGVTQVGPHRDDLLIRLDGRDISRFGSRGQQRMAVVALKLAEIGFISQRAGVRPVLLLDDVLSELDPDHRGTLLNEVSDAGCQLMVTATEMASVQHESLDQLKLARLTAPGSLEVVED